MSYHFKNDGHWTPKGHLLAASAISAKFFSNNGNLTKEEIYSIDVAKSHVKQTEKLIKLINL